MCARVMYAITTSVLMTLAMSIQAAAQTVQFTEREVVFRNGEVELHGTLMLPTVRTPSPAIVFLHGSGPHPRAGFRPYAEEFAELGVASLFFDKRGSGDSGGSWVTASLDDLAGDALAAVDHLAAEPGIDADRIGFWGISQAGWVAPLAASRSDDVAFMMLISGGGASPRESEMFSWEREFESAGLSAEETARATGALEAYYDYLATGERRAELVARLDELRPGRLSPLADQLDGILPSEDNRANWSWVATHDPAPHIESFAGPLLLMFGAEDTDHPTTLAAERWREGLGTAGNDRVTLMVFPGAGHGIRMREGYGGGGRAPFADGYIEVQLGWLWRHVIAGAEGACVLPTNPTTILEDGGLVLKVWRFPLEEVHVRPVLPDEPGLLEYRATIRAEGADERYPELHVPPTPSEGEAAVWRDENFNNHLAYREGVGSIESITCLDALLFAEQNARAPQLERPTEFLASVLRRRLMEGDEVVVVFGAGTELFPPSSVHGFEIVDEYVAAGWRYWYVLHNHTRQANGALGVPVPSTSDVGFARRLAARSGLERIRVTNGFYSFDATVAEISRFRSR